MNLVNICKIENKSNELSVCQLVKTYLSWFSIGHLMFLPGIWLACCFEFTGPLRQYFSLYRTVFQREESK